MNISRLTALSLGLAIAVFSLAFANPSSAKGNECDPGDTRPKCFHDDDDSTGITYAVELIEGAFIVVPAQPVTLEADNWLKGDQEFTVTRPGLPTPCSVLAASGDDAAEACETWSQVFDVCGLYDINAGADPYGPDAFVVEAGRKGWEVNKWVGGVQFVFRTSISSPISSDDLNVQLRLESDCSYDSADSKPLCEPFLPVSPTVDNTLATREHDLTTYNSQARGKGGVTHQAPCHATEGDLVFEVENPTPPPDTLDVGVNSKLVITAAKCVDGKVLRVNTTTNELECL